MPDLTERQIADLPAEPTPFVATSDIKQRAQSIRNRREIPPFPGKRVTFKEMHDWLELLKPEMEERINVYVYRVRPRIVRQLSNKNNPNNIDVTYSNHATNLTEQYMIEKHGGGKYKFLVKDVDESSELKGYFEASLDINEGLYFPKLEMAEVDWTHNDNRGFRALCRAQGKIDENDMPIDNNKPTTNTATTATPGVDLTGVLKIIMDFVSKQTVEQQREFKRNIGGEEAVNKALSDVLLERTKQDDPNKHIQTMTSLMSAMGAMNKGQDIMPIITMITTMMTTMIDQSNKHMMLMVEIFKAQNKPTAEKEEEGDEIDKLSKLMDFAERMKGEGKKSTAEVIADKLGDALPSIMGTISGILNLQAAKLHGGMAGTQPPIIPTNPETQTNQPTTANPLGLPASEDADIQNAIKQYGGMILGALNAGKPGWQFAEDIANLFGHATVATVSKYGVDKLISGAKGVPEFWTPVNSTFGEAYMRQWLDDFINYQEFDDEEEEATDATNSSDGKGKSV